MRESNFAFPAQNKACVCITSQLYDRRALDTTSPLPLFNSLTHLTYLTSTSPRIREIMTMDGGLERLVKILHEFCMCPPPPENPAILYGLMPPNARMPKLTPTLNPHSFDKHAAYRFSLAFQCIVNIGVRGNEPIRSRVVQAGALEVVGCILEAWLANKGFSVGPSASASGIPRETREQRHSRRMAQEAAHLQRALQREERRRDDEPAESSTSLLLSDSYSQPSTSNSDNDMSADNSITATPQGSGTPTGSVLIPSRDRSGTIIARPIWDQSPAATAVPPRVRRNRHRELPPVSPNVSTDASRAETETEDDADIDMDRTRENERLDSDVASPSASPSPERHSRNISRHAGTRRAVGIVSDEPIAGPQTLQVGGLGIGGTDAHIIINEAGGGEGGVEVGVEDGIVSLETNDDFAMGAPPGAPGAMGEGATPRPLNIDGGRRRNTIDAPDVTPRAAAVGLPMVTGATTTGRGANQATAPLANQRTATIRARAGGDTTNTVTQPAAGAAAAAGIPNQLGVLGLPRTNSTASHNHHHRDTDSGPYRDEDVLLSMQLLAYLSKYPHVRQAFYKPRVTFHPASVNLPGARFGVGQPVREKQKQREGEKVAMSAPSSSASSAATSPSGSGPTRDSYFRTFNLPSSSRGKDRANPQASTSQPTVATAATGGAPSSARQTNVFSLVERFTYKPSTTETDQPNPPPRLPQEIQYWAGVIMRNACRKDDSRGGIRQCANMMCGKWETFPREFAKCRRCRKAKYCGKECQSTAWSEGHRFWCSAKETEDDNLGDPSVRDATTSQAAVADQSIAVEGNGAGVGAGGTATTPRRRERHNHNNHHHTHPSDTSDVSTVRGTRTVPTQPPAANYVPPPASSTSTARAESSMSRDRTIQPNMAESSTSRMRATGRPQPPQLSQTQTTITGTVNTQASTSTDQQRRRAETITGPLQSTSSSATMTPSMAAGNAAAMRAAAAQRPPAQTAVPPNFAPTMRPPLNDGVSPLTSPPDWSSAATHPRRGVDSQVSPTTLGGVRQDTNSPRRHRPPISPNNPNMRRPPPSDEEHDHMVLG